jgi:hypothetical protein
MMGNDAYGAADIGMWINGGVAGAPVITHVFGDTAGAIPTANLAGSIWAGGQAGIYLFPNGTTSGGSGLETGAAFQTPSFTPSTNEGIFITLTFDTTGIAPGVYSFSLNNPNFTNNFYGALDENFDPIPTPLTVLDGTLTVVPEPASVMLGSFAIAGLALVATRSRSRRAA